MSRSYSLAEKDYKRAIQGMTSEERRLSMLDKVRMRSTRKSQIRGPFNINTDIYIKNNEAWRAAIPMVNIYKQENEARKSAFLQALTKNNVPRYIIKDISLWLTDPRHHNRFAAKNRKRTYKKKNNKKKSSKNKK